jgi:hypothetical protein
MLHRTKRTILLTFIFGVVALACAPAALGQTTTTQDMQFTSVPILNTCTGDTILMSGTLHSVMGFSTNPNGMTHTTMDFTTHATGVGLTGLNYVINDSSHQEVNTRGVAQEQSFGTKMKMISQGSAPNLTERTTLHVVIEGNNNVKVEKSTDTISCK